MINEKEIDKIIERLIKRIEDANEYFLMQIGSSLKKIRDLKPADAQKLIQILKYGGKYDEIIKKISKYTDMNVKDIKAIFEAYSKRDLMFAEKFYKYRNIPFKKYTENIALQNQTIALRRMVEKEVYNFSRTNILGYTIKDLRGNVQFLGLKETYNKVLDEALLNVGQGKESFDTALVNILKEIGGSGLKTIEYASGRSMRLDSAIRMHLQGRLRELHNENQKLFGKEFDADGIEISVHENPAPDHASSQGRQFSKKEFDKLQAGKTAIDYKGISHNLDHDNKNGYRPISEMNCYHYVFSIVLGVSEPEYTDKELQEIIDRNEQGFEYEGKHYTMYEGTQLQRALERKIREQKDIQILGRASNNTEIIDDAQKQIKILTNKYNEVNKISGLPKKMDRLRVPNYRRVAIKK